MSNLSRMEYIQRQQHVLFDLFPEKDNIAAKYQIVSLEIFRIHHRAQDFRNAYSCHSKLLDVFPNNPYFISHFGRFCLEIGKKVEALSLFQLVEDRLAQETELQPLHILNQAFVKVYDG